MFLQMVQQYGYWGVGLLIFVETVFPPIPSEAVLLFAGFLTVKAELNLWWVVFWATAGAVLGAILLYGAGRGLGLGRLERLAAGKWGRLLHFGPEKLHKADRQFAKRAYTSVLVCRCVPLLRSIISIPAGLTAMPFLPFLGLTVTGSYLWNTVLVWMGRLAGDAWQQRANKVGEYSLWLLAGLGILGVLWLTWRAQAKKRRA